MYKKYQNDANYSYIEGVFGIVELLKHRQKDVLDIFVSKDLKLASRQLLEQLFGSNVIENDKQVERLAGKEKSLAVAVFQKFTNQLQSGNHLVLANIMDAGNLGTIIRTALGFNFTNIAIIEPAVDYYNPKVLRASMGAFFSCQIETFSSFEDYHQRWPNQELYPFMLQAPTTLSQVVLRQPFSLIFGNESAGLDPLFIKIGNPIRIEHDKTIDSLNLANAVAIGLWQAFVSSS